MSMPALGSMPIRAAVRNHVLSVAILVVGLSLTALAFILVRNQEQRTIKDAFLKAAQTHISEISEGLAQNIHLVRSIKAYFGAAGDVSREGFRAFVQPLLTQYVGVEALNWIPRVTAENRDNYEKAAQRDFPGFQITEYLNPGVLVRAKPRPEYFPVYYIEPSKGHERALGFDLGSDPARLETVSRARDTGTITASPRIRIVVEKAEQFGFLVSDPIYRNTHTTTLEERRANLLGFSLGVFRIEDVVEAAMSRSKPTGVDLTIHDESADPSQSYLYTHYSRTRNSRPASEAGPIPVTDLTYTARLDLADRTWAIKVTPAPGHYDMSTNVDTFAVLLMGCAITLALVAYAVQRQRAMQESEDRLQFIEQLIGAIPSPVFYKDKNGRYLGCNESFAKHAGVRREELIGKTAYNIWPKDSADKIQAIDEKLLKNPGIHESQEFESSRRASDGTSYNMLMRKTTFFKRDGSIGGIVGTMWDITEKKLVEQMLREQALHDPLTTLYNRRYLDEILESEFSRAARSQGSIGIVMADIDKFKHFNDTFGHDCGDEVLRVVAQILRAQFRKGDIVCRYGGEEFTIVLPGATLEDAHRRTVRVCEAIRDSKISCGGRAVGPVTVSFGVAIYPKNGDAPDIVLKAADAALLRAKREGRDHVNVAGS